MYRGLRLVSAKRGRGLAAVASTLLIWGSFAVVVDAASFKPYDIGGVTGPNGATPGTVTLTLSVPSTANQQLGSIEVYVSTGFGLSSVSSNGSLLPGSTTTAIFQNLNVQPGGAPASISFDVSAPCGTNTLTWSFVAQQSNQWQSGGTKANYLTLETVTYINGYTLGTSGQALKDAVTSVYDNTSCTYSLTGIPSSVVGGANPVSLGITNGSGGTLTSVTASVQSPYSITYNGSTAGSATFQVNLAPNASTSVSFALNAPCAGSSFEWSFSTSPAAFTLTSPSAPITTALASPSCSIKFIFANNGVAVADAEVASGTDSTRILTAGTPGAGLGVKVGLYDVTGTIPLAISGESVRVALTPGTATLGGTTTATTGTDGTATFTNLTVSAVGTYELAASGSSQVTSGTSNPFQVVSVLQPCTGRTCTVYFNPPDGNSQSSVTATGPYPGGYFEGTVNPSGLTVSCAFSPFNYADAYDTNTTWYSFTGTGSKNVSLTINKSWVQKTTNNGLSYYRVCYAAPTSFNTGLVTGYEQDGTFDGVGTYAVPIPSDTTTPYSQYPSTDPRSAGNNATDFFGMRYYVGTLGTCSRVGNVAPCVSSTSGAGGNRTLNFITPPGDPSYR